MNQPNLFRFATKELSHDAFVAWLLNWADPKYKDADEELWRCGTNLIKRFMQKPDIGLTIDTLEVHCQRKNIDVYCRVNGSHSFIIEDKIRSSAHSDQLKRYLEAVQKDYPNDKVYSVYYKIHDQDNYDHVNKNNYPSFTRQDMLETLNSCKSENQVLKDYRDNLNHIDSLYRFENISHKIWTHEAWMSFYSEIKKQFGEGSWWVWRNGLDTGYSWAITEHNNNTLFLQLRKDAIHIRCKREAGDINKEESQKYSSAMYEAFSKHEHFKTSRRWSYKGKTDFLIAKVTNYLVLDSGILDTKATIANLREITGEFRNILKTID